MLKFSGYAHLSSGRVGLTEYSTSLDPCMCQWSGVGAGRLAGRPADQGVSRDSKPCYLRHHTLISQPASQPARPPQSSPVGIAYRSSSEPLAPICHQVFHSLAAAEHQRVSGTSPSSGVDRPVGSSSSSSRRQSTAASASTNQSGPPNKVPCATRDNPPPSES